MGFSVGLRPPSSAFVRLSQRLSLTLVLVTYAVQVPLRSTRASFAPWACRSDAYYLVQEIDDMKHSMNDRMAAIERNYDRTSQKLAEVNQQYLDLIKQAEETKILTILCVAMILLLPVWFVDYIFKIIGKQLP